MEIVVTNVLYISSIRRNNCHYMECLLWNDRELRDCMFNGSG